MSRFVCTFLLAACAVQAQKPLLDRVDDQVYRGRQPKRDDFAKLALAGIRTVLDLRSGLAFKPWEKKMVEDAGMRYVHIGLSGLFAPSGKQMERILAVLQDTAHGPVFVHCRRGADRSGMAIACYRIVHYHWTNAEALAEARKNGLSCLEILMQRYVEHFRPDTVRGHTAASAASAAK